MNIDVQVNKREATAIIKRLKSHGFDTTEAEKDLKQRSPLYNIYLYPGMTQPQVTYARG